MSHEAQSSRASDSQGVTSVMLMSESRALMIVRHGRMPGSRPMLSFRGAPPHYEHDPQRRPGRAREIRSAGRARRTMPNSQLEEKLSYFQRQSGRAATPDGQSTFSHECRKLARELTRK
jgi:hypothetical protein